MTLIFNNKGNLSMTIGSSEQLDQVSNSLLTRYAESGIL